jgi:hypothetical protein
MRLGQFLRDHPATFIFILRFLCNPARNDDDDDASQSMTTKLMVISSSRRTKNEEENMHACA